MQDESSDISVIIPVYNAERFIEKAVRSACEQDEVMEVILIEDGSTDNSLRICNKLVQVWKPVVKLYRSNDKKNQGASSPRNLGIIKSKGKYIAFLDADDYYLPGRFKHDLEILASDPNIDGVYNALGVNIYDDEEKDRIKHFLTTVKYFIPPEQLFEEMGPVGTAGYFHCDTLTVNRNVFRKVGLFDENLEMCEDTHMWIKMASTVTLRAGIIDRPVSVRGVHKDNRVKDVSKLFYYRHIMYISLLEWCNENNISAARIEVLWHSFYKIFDRSIDTKNLSKYQIKRKVIFFLIKYGLLNPHHIFDARYISSFSKLSKL